MLLGLTAVLDALLQSWNILARCRTPAKALWAGCMLAPLSHTEHSPVGGCTRS